MLDYLNLTPDQQQVMADTQASMWAEVEEADQERDEAIEQRDGLLLAGRPLEHILLAAYVKAGSAAEVVVAIPTPMIRALHAAIAAAEPKATATMTESVNRRRTL